MMKKSTMGNTTPQAGRRNNAKEKLTAQGRSLRNLFAKAGKQKSERGAPEILEANGINLSAALTEELHDLQVRGEG